LPEELIQGVNSLLMKVKKKIKQKAY